MKNIPDKKIFLKYLPLLLIPLGVLLYSNVLNAPFVYDDEAYVLANRQIRSLGNFLDLSGTRYIGFLSFALNYSTGGLVPFDFHLVNILIHVLNSILVFSLVRNTFRTPFIKGIHASDEVSVYAAFIAAVIFLSHPVESQAVSYVTQRFTSLAAFFYISSVLLYVKARIGWAQGKGGTANRLFYAGSLLSAVIAMKTKEISFTLPFAIALYEFVFFRPEIKSSARYRIPFYFTLVIIPLTLLGPDIGIFGNYNASAEHLRNLQINEAARLPRSVYFFTELKVVVTYIRLLLLPVGQRLEYDYPVSTSLFDPPAFMSFLFLSSLILISFFVLRSSRKTGNIWGHLFPFGVFWFFLTLSVESTLVPIQDFIYEHRVYLPSVGLLISFVSLVFWTVEYLNSKREKKISYKVLTAGLLIILCPALFTSLYLRNNVWNDEMALLNDSIGKSPGKSRLYYFRGLLNLKKNKFAEALYDADKVLSMNPKIAEAHNLRGVAYSGLGDHRRSIESFSAALALNRDYEIVYLNRGISYAASGRHKEALKDFDQAAVIYPGFSEFIKSPLMKEVVTGIKRSCLERDMDGCGRFMDIPINRVPGGIPPF
ncbi:MAG: tetratricopeptide repeat protein [Deltaproteobacteria bacterium]|nr:tetratricopeptide repeat protein [Deltaproteobacteria bacterium]